MSKQVYKIGSQQRYSKLLVSPSNSGIGTQENNGRNDGDSALFTCRVHNLENVNRLHSLSSVISGVVVKGRLGMFDIHCYLLDHLRRQ